MLPFTQAQAVVAIPRPLTILAPVVLANAILLPLGQRIVVGVVVIVSIGAHSPEHLINLGLRRPTSAYRVLWMLLDAARHGGVARPAVHRCRLRQDYGTVRRVGVVRRPTGVFVMRPASRATGHEDPQSRDPMKKRQEVMFFMLRRLDQLTMGRQPGSGRDGLAAIHPFW